MWFVKKLKNNTSVSAGYLNIVYVLAGDISIHIKNKDHQIPKKSFFYYDTDFKVTSTSPYYDGFIISLDQSTVEVLPNKNELLPDQSHYFKAFKLHEADFIKSLLSSLVKENKNQSDLINSYLTILLLKTHQQQKSTSSTHSTIYSQFIDLIQENIEKNYCAGTYANMLNIPLKELIEEVKLHTHQTPCNVITHQVIEKAKKLLTTTKDSSKMIAYQLGFQEPYYFIKYFKKKVGVTPTQFRKEH
ncbi:helix-turn-helix domain-containing protein [Tenacibaculum sp. TC6]|uniref:helix-turn-helix domain-containing protein n=1 Tax=Tenacibaculum sp. TC6 TaxID=3423223 RepID=UPI003D36F5AF